MMLAIDGFFMRLLDILVCFFENRMYGLQILQTAIMEGVKNLLIGRVAGAG